MMKYFAILLFFVARCFSANIYVIDGGSGSGTSWSDALDDIPSTIGRGNTVYLADGNYASYTFDESQSSTIYCFIKKATENDHGTETGWNSTYGDGEAVISGGITIVNGCGYFEINGQEEYGIRITFTEGNAGVSFLGDAPNSRLYYLDIDGPIGAETHFYTSQTTGIEFGIQGANNTDNLHISHCTIHGGDTLIQTLSTDNLVLEYCELKDARSSNPAVHANIFFISGGNDGVIRYNRISNMNAEGIFFTYGGQTGWKIYGNIFYDGVDTGRGIEIRQDFDYGAFEIYNNTFANLSIGINNVAESTSGSIGRNNLSYNAGLNWGDFSTTDNNTSDTVDRFVDIDADDYRLNSALPGVSLSSEFNQDMYGATRGVDGTWDRGAYEFGETETDPVFNITTLTVQ